MPVISSPTRSRYSSYIMSRSASRMRCRMTCLAVCAAIRPKSSGVTSRSSIWSRYSANFFGSISGSSGSRISPVSGSIVVSSSIVSTIRCASRRSGIFSSMTRKSAVSRSISTRAYFAEPGCFLYAERSASSSAIISFSGSMPFSRASACIASRISRDIAGFLLLDQVGTANLRVRDRDHAAVRGERHLILGSPHQLSCEAAHRARRTVRRTVDGPRMAHAHTRAPADEAPEVRGLGQRTVAAGRGDLQRVTLAEVVQQHRHALAHRQVDALWVVDEHAQAAPAEHLGEEHLDLRLVVFEPLFDLCLERVHLLVDPGLYAKRAGVRPLSVLLPALARRHESCASRIAPGGAPFTSVSED